MKLLPYLVVLACLLTSHLSWGYSADSLDSKPTTHYFEVLAGTFIGTTVLNQSSNTSKAYYSAQGQVAFGQVQYINGPYGIFSGVFARPHFTPGYSVSAGFNYRTNFSDRLGMRTGLHYTEYSYVAKGTFESVVNGSPPYANSTQTYSRTVFTSLLQIPLQLLVYQKLKKGRLVFSAGPDIYLPFYASGTETVYTPGTATFVPDYPVVTMRLRSTLSAKDIVRGGSLGFSVGVGYEKQVCKHMTITLMPDFHLQNLLPFYFQGSVKDLYQNYIFNTTTGLSVFLSFSK